MVEIAINIGMVEFQRSDDRKTRFVMQKLRSFVKKGGVIFIPLHHKIGAKAGPINIGMVEFQRSDDRKTRFVMQKLRSFVKKGGVIFIPLHHKIGAKAGPI